MAHNRWRLNLKILAWMLVLAYLGVAVGRVLDLFIRVSLWFENAFFQVCGLWLAMLGGLVFSIVFWVLEEIRFDTDEEGKARSRRIEHCIRLSLLGVAAVIHLILHLGGVKLLPY